MIAQDAMIEIYYAPTPNGQKITIMLEECHLPYRVAAVDLLAGEQHEASFRQISPHGKIPAIIDSEGPDGRPFAMFETGAILSYLAEKCGQFGGDDDHSRWLVQQWLHFQVASLGPFLGQAHHFFNYAPDPIEYAQQRYHREAMLLYGVLNERLVDNEYLAGNYSIADMATYPWIAARRAHRVDLADFPHVERWYQRVKARPAVQRGFAVLRDQLRRPSSARDRMNLFGIGEST